MIEELKIVSELLTNLGEGALQGIIVFMGLSFLKPLIIVGVVCKTLTSLVTTVLKHTVKESNNE